MGGGTCAPRILLNVSHLWHYILTASEACSSQSHTAVTFTVTFIKEEIVTSIARDSFRNGSFTDC